MSVAVISFPGSNCENDTRHVLESVCGARVRLVWHREDTLADAEAVVIPGGFSYGDYLRSGALAAHSPIMAAVKRFAARGGPVLGICNGFQILTEAGLLPGQLARNPSLHFKCEPVHLRVETTRTPFTHAYTRHEVLTMPIAHNEGQYYAPPDVVESLEAEGRVVFRYVTAAGEPSSEANPNGSLANIAGVVNTRGNVLGMMPHPERAAETLLGSADGLKLFTSLLSRLEAGTMA